MKKPAPEQKEPRSTKVTEVLESENFLVLATIALRHYRQPEAGQDETPE